MQRQNDEGQCKRDPEPDPNRNVGLAESRKQHHHRADACEDQHERGSKSRQKRDVDAHEGLFRASIIGQPIMRYPPMIRDDIRIIWLFIASAMKGSANISATKIARIFGTNTKVCS